MKNNEVEKDKLVEEKIIEESNLNPYQIKAKKDKQDFDQLIDDIDADINDIDSGKKLTAAESKKKLNEVSEHLKKAKDILLRSSSAAGTIVIKDLRKYFGDKHVLKDVNISFEPGKIYGFLGNNGAGKTTMMRILFNMELPTSGSITYKGLPHEKIDFTRWFYFTETDVMPTSYRVKDYLKEIGYLYNLPDGEINKRIEEVTGFMDFNFALDQRIKTLSSGQQKIVGCMGLLIAKPEVVFLDEPTANMDVWNQKIVMKIIKKLHTPDRIVVITTHLLKEIGDTLTDAVILDDGVVKYQAPVKKGEDIEAIFKEYTTDGSAEAHFDDVELDDKKSKKKKTYNSNSFDKKMIGEYLNE